MYFTRAIIYLLGLVVCLSCDKESNTPDDILELRMDFTEEEFLLAIIGKWETVWEFDEVENVTYLEFDDQGYAKITLKYESTEEDFEGNYTVEFTLIPEPGEETRADITIKSAKRNILLSGVHFGLHSGLSGTKLFFRTHFAPIAVLSRIE